MRMDGGESYEALLGRRWALRLRAINDSKLLA